MNETFWIKKITEAERNGPLLVAPNAVIYVKQLIRRVRAENSTEYDMPSLGYTPVEVR